MLSALISIWVHVFPRNSVCVHGMSPSECTYVLFYEFKGQHNEDLMVHLINCQISKLRLFILIPILLFYYNNNERSTVKLVLRGHPWDKENVS